MTIYQFTLLDELKQMEALWDGVFIGRVLKNGFEYECRQVDYFYVECRIAQETREYLSMRTFTNPDLLQPYLDLMDVPLL